MYLIQSFGLEIRSPIIIIIILLILILIINFIPNTTIKGIRGNPHQLPLLIVGHFVSSATLQDSSHRIFFSPTFKLFYYMGTISWLLLSWLQREQHLGRKGKYQVMLKINLSTCRYQNERMKIEIRKFNHMLKKCLQIY